MGLGPRLRARAGPRHTARVRRARRSVDRNRRGVSAGEGPMKLHINGVERALDVDPEMPLLWVLRDVLNLSGTKYGCGQALCGACTVHLDGHAVRACVTPMRRAEGKAVTTIEGLST